MGLGAFGQVLMFVMSLVAATILGLIVAARAAHCFLVIVESTAAGMDEFPWPNDPFLDWLWKPIYLFGLITFWILLGWLVLFVADANQATTLPGIAGVILGAVWICFPISLFSSLSAQNLVSLLYWPVLRRLGRRIGYLLLLYILTAPLIAGGAALVYLAVMGDALWLLLAGLLGTLAFFVHARLLGRLAWLIGQRTPLKERKPRKAANPFKKLKIEVTDPWGISEAESPSLAEAIVAAQPEPPTQAPAVKPVDGEEVWGVPQEPYGVMNEVQARESWQQRAGDVPLEEGYDVAPAATTPGGEAAPPLRPPEPLLLEERLRIENQPAPPPRLLFWSGVLSFPFYNRTLPSWLGLSGLVMAELFFVRVMVAMAPP